MNNKKIILLIGRTGNGKSTLANVISGSDDFGESAGSVSKTKKIEFKEFKYEGEKYRIVDTFGIGDTRMSLDKVLRKLALMGYSVKDGLSQILFVTDGKLVEEAKFTYDLLKKVVFDEKIFQYTTVVRTNFPYFRDKDSREEDKKKLIENSGGLKELIENCKKIIYVDNPPVDIINDEERVNLNKRIRELSREILLKNLKNDIIYKPDNLDELSRTIDEHVIKKEELKKKENKGIIARAKRIVKNKSLNDKVTGKMVEHIGRIDPQLKKILTEELNLLWRNKSEERKVASWKFGNSFSKNVATSHTSIEAEGNVIIGGDFSMKNIELQSHIETPPK